MLTNRRPAFVFDVDGTLALRGDRDPYRWQDAEDDRPNVAVIAVAQAIAASGVALVYVSGRPEEARDLTERWIEREVTVPGPLFMRPSRDFRKDTEVKRELYHRHIEPNFDVVAVFDDRDQVVRMWRDELLLTCFQVADGTF